MFARRFDLLQFVSFESRVPQQIYSSCWTSQRNHFQMSGGRYASPRCPDDWDPMVADYYDSNFNSYNYGPGARLDSNLQPWNQRAGEKRVYKLHVTNVPTYMEPRALRNFFINLNAAPPSDVYINPSPAALTWAFVSYGKHSDAEFAIRAVSMQPPFHMKVQFALSEEERNHKRALAIKESEKWKTALECSPYIPVAVDSCASRVAGVGRGHMLRNQSMRPGFFSEPVDLYSDYYSDPDSEMDAFEYIRENAISKVSMEMLKNASLQVETGGGHRRVSMGRGFYLSSDKAERKPGEALGRVVPDTTGQPRRYEAGCKPPMDEGFCGFCNRVTTKQCGQCSIQWYCSRECQRRDWGVHRELCKPIPILKDSAGTPRQEPLGESNGEVRTPTTHPVSQSNTMRTTANNVAPLHGFSTSPIRQLANKTAALTLSNGLENSQSGLLGDFPGDMTKLETTIKPLIPEVELQKIRNNYQPRNNGSQGDNVDERQGGSKFGDKSGEGRNDYRSGANGNQQSRNYQSSNDRHNYDRARSSEDGNRQNYGQSRNNQDRNERQSFGRSRNEDDGERQSYSKLKNSRDGNDGHSFGRLKNNEDGGERQNYGKFKSNQGGNDRQNCGHPRINQDGNDRQSFARARNNENGGERQNYGSLKTSRDGNDRQNYGQSRSSLGGNERHSYGKSRNEDSGERQKYGKSRYGQDGDRQNQGRPKNNEEVGGRNDGQRRSYSDAKNRDNNDKRQFRAAQQVDDSEDWGEQGTSGQSKNESIVDGSNQKCNEFDSLSKSGTEAMAENQSKLSDHHMDNELSPLSSDTPAKPLKESSSADLKRDKETETVELPAGAFTEVKVVINEEPGVYWVQLVSSEKDFMAIVTDLADLDNNSPCADVKVGALCASYYEEMWFRSKVLATDPELKIHYIDFGNTETVEDKTRLKSLPTFSQTLPGLAFKIQVAPGTSDKWKSLVDDETFLVKPVKVMDDVVVVHVEGEVYNETEEPVVKSPSEKVESKKSPSEKVESKNSPSEKVESKKSPSEKVESKKSPSEKVESKNSPSEKVESKKSPSEKVESKTNEMSESVPKTCDDKTNMPVAGNEKKLLNSCLSLLECGTVGFLMCNVLVEQERFVAGVVSEDFKDSFLKVMGGELDKEASAAPDLPDPQPRDLVMAKTPEGWFRAYIITVKENGYGVAVCDTGKLEEVTEVKVLPGCYRNICAMTLQCSVTDCLTKPDTKAKELLKVSQRFKFEVITTSETAAQVFLKEIDGEKPCFQAKLTAWIPPFRHNVKCVELKEGPYFLSSFVTSKNMYVRPADRSSDIAFKVLLQEVNGFCHFAPNLSEKPCIGDLVAGKFSGDGNYYRALIRNIDENEIKVTYVDFGNSEILRLDQLKPLTEQLKATPCFSLRVGLKDVVDEPLNKECGKFLGQVVQEEQELKLKIVDLPSKVVELYLPDGTCVNEKINTILKPSWKATSTIPFDAKEIFTLDEMVMQPDLPVGQMLKVGILYILSHNQVAIMNMNDEALIEASSAMLQKIAEYCSSDNNSYVPRYGELCLALFEGEWYRATCIEAGRTISVMFIDYGNFETVKHTDIRKMVKEFCEIPPMAYLCTINGIGDDIPTAAAVKERLKELLPTDTIFQAKILEKVDSSEYVIEVPTVVSNLANEGLLQ